TGILLRREVPEMADHRLGPLSEQLQRPDNHGTSLQTSNKARSLLGPCATQRSSAYPTLPLATDLFVRGPQNSWGVSAKRRRVALGRRLPAPGFLVLPIPGA